MTSATDLFIVRAAPGKGLGIFATNTIKRGTRIICEAPLLRIARNDPHLAWKAYQRLSPQARQEYDQLHRFRRTELDLVREARTRLPGSDDPKVLADQVAVMERFSANNFMILGGNEHAVFKFSSRINHSCEPNVFQCFNPCLGMKTVHAMRDIQAGEEFETNYLGRECHYSSRTQRWEVFRSQWGFTCHCTACTDRTGVSDARHSLLGKVIYGLEEFIAGNPEMYNPFLPPSTLDALDQARDALSLCLEQNMYGPELVLAHRLISTFALELEDYQTALEAADNAQEVERNNMGTELDDLKAKGAGADVWKTHVLEMMRKAGFHSHQQRKPKKGTGKKNHKRSEQRVLKEVQSEFHQQKHGKKENHHQKQEKKVNHHQKQEKGDKQDADVAKIAA
ncbi:hypothetical protein DOTSEDRAFT_177455 [Dothistroma septosporum NZE10]|uniref:SET domain-containing protein n=1 Tax=Dothistroma septosporum (strain NZE10 / CBS 128990) TaxID=675120 RepID=N1PCZ7_DOTSN|nr:hypothetical protein DOTSEDRAFT_177455 [Dothistroma septosporum NZE10]